MNTILAPFYLLMGAMKQEGLNKGSSSDTFSNPLKKNVALKKNIAQNVREKPSGRTARGRRDLLPGGESFRKRSAKIPE